jgi:hypothetical protein
LAWASKRFTVSRDTPRSLAYWVWDSVIVGFATMIIGFLPPLASALHLLP